VLFCWEKPISSVKVFRRDMELIGKISFIGKNSLRCRCQKERVFDKGAFKKGTD
jgi:hypothetical protein